MLADKQWPFSETLPFFPPISQWTNNLLIRLEFEGKKKFSTHKLNQFFINSEFEIV